MKATSTRIQLSALLLLLITNSLRAQIGPGSALELLGTNHAVVASNPSLTLTTSFTFEAWIEPEKPACGSILSRGSGFDGTTDYNFVIGWNGTNCGTQMKLALYAGGWHYSAGEVPVNAWSHVAATYDGTNVSLYINGVLSSTTPQSGSVYQSGSPLYIGRQGQTCNCNTFQGQLDEVRIWNIARSADDITADMSFWLSGTESNLVAYYRFEEGKGLVVSNSAATGSANDGTLAGATTWTSSDALFSPDPETGTPKLDINNTAWVSGSVNPGNLATLAYIEWGATTGYGTQTAATNLVGKNQAFSLATVQLTGLTEFAPYHYHVVGSNSAGINYGKDILIVSAPFTDSATNITGTSASLNGVVDPQGVSTVFYFQYGTTTNYGSFSATNAMAVTNGGQTVSTGVSGLAAASMYHYRVVSSSAGGTAFGNDVAFLTLTTNSGSWTRLATPPLGKGTIGPTFLLSDGTVLAQYSGGTDWYQWFRLTPDAQGSYLNGTWTWAADMRYFRSTYGTTVLRDGRVLIAGGEFGNGTNSAEIYDPVADIWTETAPPTNSYRIYDASTVLLPDGRVMVGIVNPFPVDASANGYAIIYDPITDTWTNTGHYARGLYSPDEASWVKLPDNSILQVDPTGSHAERYIPALNSWIVDADVATNLWHFSEMGGSLLLPNGNAFWQGGSGHTAIYKPSGTTNIGNWIAGADIPNACAPMDAPSAMMVNGKILCTVTRRSSIYAPPTTFYEYDYLNNSFALVNAPGGGTELAHDVWAASGSCMLDLPDGSVLFTQYTTNVYVYRPVGPPLAAGKPTILGITTNLDGSLHLTGTLFNGISAGAAYGDDLQVDSNFPLVRFTSTNGIVRYGRTYNWSSTGVQTGTNVVSTECKIPTGVSAWDTIQVVANGIASDGVGFPGLVTTLADSGPGSLRQVVAGSPSGGVIRFAANLSGLTILLTSGPITLDKNLLIDGTTVSHGMWVNANASSRILNVQAGVTVTINSLILINGSDATIAGIANNGTLTLNNCTVADNVSSGGVGGIDSFVNSQLTLNNCTVTVNSGDIAGGILSAGSLTLNNCTVAGNSGGSAGGLAVSGLSPGPAQVNNTILSGNTGSTPNVFGSLTGVNNLLDVADPQLGPIGDHGGLTPTMPPLPGSPAVDAGSDAAAAAAGLTTDQRGLPRKSGDHVDIGAAELQLVTSSTPAQIGAVTTLPDGTFQLSFINQPGASFRVFAATNVNLPWSNWTMIGFVAESGSGQFQFIDSQATNYPQRFFRVRSP